MVGYNCDKGVSRRKLFFFLNLLNRNQSLFSYFSIIAELVIQTREEFPSQDVLDEAYACIRKNGLPMTQLVCGVGFSG